MKIVNMTVSDTYMPFVAEEKIVRNYYFISLVVHVEIIILEQCGKPVTPSDQGCI